MALRGGSSKSNDDSVSQSVRIEKELFIRLKMHSAESRQSQQAILHDALVEFLDRHEKPQPRTRKGKN